MLVGEPLTTLTTTSNHAGPRQPPVKHVTLHCRTTRLRIALVVQGKPGAPTPVLVDDVHVASLRPTTGIAHAVVELPRNTKYRVRLAPANATSTPNVPAVTLRTQDFDDVVYVNAKPRPKPRRKRREPTRPRRID